MIKQLSCAIAALALTGCASITGKQMQQVTVTTTQDSKEVAGIGCTLSNDVGTWFVTTPGTATVHKSTDAMIIDCKRDTLVGNSRVESSANTNVWGNVLLGGIVGYVVDRQTGAGFDYPGSAAVSMRPVSTGATPAAVQPAVTEPAGRTTATQTQTQPATPGRTVAGAPR
jgi:hypothetical protein